MKDLTYLQLFDAYGALLTEHQREVCELYYMYDLSLAEIAEQKGTSRQSVSDTLAKSRAALDDYEAKLHHVAVMREADLEISGMAHAHPARPRRDEGFPPRPLRRDRSDHFPHADRRRTHRHGHRPRRSGRHGPRIKSQGASVWLSFPPSPRGSITSFQS